MQLSKLSLITLFLTSFSAAISLEDAIAARDIVLAKAAGEAIQKRNLEVRTPNPAGKKVKGSGGGGDDEDDDENSAAPVHINMALITGAGALAVAAMML
ncbi:hypothetical protein TWF281_011673 [Arthrobotrys megalospora]